MRPWTVLSSAEGAFSKISTPSEEVDKFVAFKGRCLWRVDIETLDGSDEIHFFQKRYAGAS
jgi:hypothetical protein